MEPIEFYGVLSAISPFQGLVIISILPRGDAPSSLAPGYHISRRWRWNSLAVPQALCLAPALQVSLCYREKSPLTGFFCLEAFQQIQ
jgi:hypothetical protein